jgi:hypothetical protein
VGGSKNSPKKKENQELRSSGVNYEEEKRLVSKIVQAESLEGKVEACGRNGS